MLKEPEEPERVVAVPPDDRFARRFVRLRVVIRAADEVGDDVRLAVDAQPVRAQVHHVREAPHAPRLDRAPDVQVVVRIVRLGTREGDGARGVLGDREPVAEGLDALVRCAGAARPDLLPGAGAEGDHPGVRLPVRLAAFTPDPVRHAGGGGQVGLVRRVHTHRGANDEGLTRRRLTPGPPTAPAGWPRGAPCPRQIRATARRRTVKPSRRPSVTLAPSRRTSRITSIERLRLQQCLEHGFGHVRLPPGAPTTLADLGRVRAVRRDVVLLDGAGELGERATVGLSVADVGDAQAAAEQAAHVLAIGAEDGAPAVARGGDGGVDAGRRGAVDGHVAPIGTVFASFTSASRSRRSRWVAAGAPAAAGVSGHAGAAKLGEQPAGFACCRRGAVVGLAGRRARARIHRTGVRESRTALRRRSPHAGDDDEAYEGPQLPAERAPGGSRTSHTAASRPGSSSTAPSRWPGAGASRARAPGRSGGAVRARPTVWHRLAAGAHRVPPLRSSPVGRPSSPATAPRTSAFPMAYLAACRDAVCRRPAADRVRGRLAGRCRRPGRRTRPPPHAPTSAP